MDWKSNFSKEEMRRIEQIVRLRNQVGYEAGSDLHILSTMVSILQNAESVINDKPEQDLLQPAVVASVDLIRPTRRNLIPKEPPTKKPPQL